VNAPGVRPGLLLAALVVLGCGCAARAPETPPLVELPETFSTVGDGQLADQWWTVFADPDLSALIEQGLGANFDLRSAWDRLAQAEAIARRETAPLFPSLDLQASTTRTELTQTAAQGSGAGGRNDVRLGIATSYEIDLWGRVRALRSAARRDVDARVADVDIAAITLSAEIAATWFELVEQRRQVDVLDAQIGTNERVLELIGLRYQRGRVAAADVLRQRQLLESTRGERPLLEARAGVLEHLLATLIGVAPGTADLPAARALPELPELPAAGLPADVIARRPDVHSAYLAILAEDRRLAAARADRYPRLSLTGNASFAARDLRDLFDNWLATLTANLVAPLLDGGSRAAEVDRVRAVVSERVHDYGQTVLIALREVEDALTRERAQREYLASLVAQLETSRVVVERIGEQYLFGATDYLEVLTALATNQNLQRRRETAVRELLGFRVELHRAIAGRFGVTRPELAGADALAAGADQ